jgi:hypothetical protein
MLGSDYCHECFAAATGAATQAEVEGTSVSEARRLALSRRSHKPFKKKFADIPVDQSQSPIPRVFGS